MPDFCLLHASDIHLAVASPRAGWPPAAVLHHLAQLPIGQYYQLIINWILQTARQTSHDPNVLRAFAQFVFDNKDAIHALLLTGDIATTGDRGDLQAAFDFLTGPALPNLAFLNRPAYKNRIQLLPGNHDRYQPMVLAQPSSLFYRPGGTQFDAVFHPTGGPAFWQVGRSVQSFGIQVDGHALWVLMADFSLPPGDDGAKYFGLPGWLGQGRVDQSILTLLGAETRRLHGPDSTIIWAIHFDPFTTDGALALLGSDMLRDELLGLAAEKIVVPAILCGHTHETKRKPLTPGTSVYACGTTAQAFAVQGNDCQLVTVSVPDSGRAYVSAMPFRYDGVTGQFLPI